MTTVPAFGRVPPDANAVKPAPRPQGDRAFEKHVPAKVDAPSSPPASAPMPRGDAVAVARNTVSVTAQLSHAAVDALFGVGAKIYPQGLAVVGYLSMAGEGDAVPGERLAGTLGGQGVAAGGFAPATIVAQGDVAGEAGRVPGAIEATGSAAAMASQGDGMAAGGVEELRSALAAEASPQWLARRLAIVDGTRGAVIYLRDFRMDEGQRGAVVDALVAHAREQGHHVSRVVVNGQECWRADAPPAPQGNGEQMHVG